MSSEAVEAQSYAHLKGLIVEVDDAGIATVTLNRPDKLNAVGAELHKTLTQVFRALEFDQAVRVIILTGKGKAFSAGGDIDWMQDMIDRPAIFEGCVRETKEIILSMLDLEKPIIAKVNGDAVGLGASLALFCDIIIAADHVRIGDPHVRAGLVAADGGAVIWPQLIGYARAKEYLLTGRLLTATEAERIGLINRVVPADGLDAAVAEFALRMAKGAQGAIRGTKATINIGLKQLAVSMLDSGLAYEVVSNVSADHAEAVKAFQEGRAPKFG